MSELKTLSLSFQGASFLDAVSVREVNLYCNDFVV